jgi:hypothetical protein
MLRATSRDDNRRATDAGDEKRELLPAVQRALSEEQILVVGQTENERSPSWRTAASCKPPPMRLCPGRPVAGIDPLMGVWGCDPLVSQRKREVSPAISAAFSRCSLVWAREASAPTRRGRMAAK